VKKRDPEPVESIPTNLRHIKNNYMNSYTGSVATQERVARHTRKIKILSPNEVEGIVWGYVCVVVGGSERSSCRSGTA